MRNRERQITFKLFEVGFKSLEQAEDGRYDIKRTYMFTTQDTRLSVKEARAEAKDKGFIVPRGAEIYIECVGTVKYFFTTDELMTIARKAEEQ